MVFVADEPMPVVVVSALNSHVVRGARGGAGTLACEARYSPAPRALPLPALALSWRRRGAPDEISLQVTNTSFTNTHTHTLNERSSTSL